MANNYFIVLLHKFVSLPQRQTTLDFKQNKLLRRPVFVSIIITWLFCLFARLKRKISLKLDVYKRQVISCLKVNKTVCSFFTAGISSWLNEKKLYIQFYFTSVFTYQMSQILQNSIVKNFLNSLNKNEIQSFYPNLTFN